MNHEKTFEAINKLKEIEIELHRLKNALEMTNRALETKDEPVAWMNRHGACKTSLFREMEAGAKEEYTIPVYTQPQRTWVGLTELDCVGWFGYDESLRLWFETNKGDDGAIPLYKDRQRTWVGLTDEEIETIYAECNVWDKFEYERMLEAKLKEKNHD